MLQAFSAVDALPVPTGTVVNVYDDARFGTPPIAGSPLPDGSPPDYSAVTDTDGLVVIDLPIGTKWWATLLVSSVRKWFPLDLSQISSGSGGGGGAGDTSEINVLDYGADPTGAADSTVAFNNASAAAFALRGGSGGIVHAPSGFYSFDGSLESGPLAWYSVVSLVGDGVEATILDFVNQSVSCVTVSDGAYIEHLKIQTDAVAGPLWVNRSASARDVWLKGSGYQDPIALRLRGAKSIQDVTIEHVNLADGVRGVIVADSVGDTVIRGITFMNCVATSGTGELISVQVDDIEITGCRSVGASCSYGVRILMAGSQPHQGYRVFNNDFSSASIAEVLDDNLAYVRNNGQSWDGLKSFVNGNPKLRGVPVIRAFPFAFDDADILTGRLLWAPKVGDILLDAWIEVDTAWDGTTPLADVGTFSGSSAGIFSSVAPIDLTKADAERFGAGLLSGNIAGESVLAANPINRTLPAKFTATHAVKVCVTQDGTNTGADPASTQGAATLYLVTTTPL